MKTVKTPRSIMMEQAERAAMFQLLTSGRTDQKPGKAIESLPQEDRDLLKELKSEDIQDIRWPLW